MKKLSILSLIAVVAVLLGACGSKNSTQKYNEGSTVMYADEGFQSFLEQEIQVFEYQYPGAFILPKYMSEVDALNGLLNDSCSIAVITRKLDKNQIEHIKGKNRKLVRQQEIAVDAVALIVNKENPVGLLSMQEIKDLFSGKLNTWRQLAWDTPDSIQIVFDQKGSANVEYIQDNFLTPGAPFPKNVSAANSNLDVIKMVEQNKAAVGFISVSWLGDHLDDLRADLAKDKIDSTTVSGLENEGETLAIDFTDRVKLLKVRKDDAVEGFQPYQAYINSGEYPLFRTVWMITTSENNSVGLSFYSFVTGFIGQKIIGLTGIMPYRVSARVVEVQ